MRVVAIISIGTYYSAWFPYTVASIYNYVDEIVVGNYGFNIYDPKPDVWIPLDRVSQDINRLDINGKITELKSVDISRLKHPYKVITQKEANEQKINDWYDIRGVSMTHTNEVAVDHGADWIMKIDSDQVCYLDIRRLRRYLSVVRVNGLKFHQYEFIGDIGGKDNYFSKPQPNSPYDDPVFVYKANVNQYYGGGGSPALFLDGGDRIGTDLIHAGHMRNANPIFITDEEKFMHFFYRVWFRLYTNQYGKFCRELDQHAKKTALDMLKYENKQPAEVQPPEVCFYKDPLDYIIEKDAIFN